MSKEYLEGQSFSGNDFSTAKLTCGEYENCTFENCSFAGTDLTDFVFVECEFRQCDLSNAILANTAFRDVRFSSCKMLGLRFDNCSDFLFEVGFEQCQLNMSSFYCRKLHAAIFDRCQLQEVDFAEADLSEASFNECNLSGAMFEYTNLQKANLVTANDYVINPETNRIDGARFSRYGLAGLLANYDIIVE
jgi:uncharacterized protein YjbI with pentapeptide repeats